MIRPLLLLVLVAGFASAADSPALLKARDALDAPVDQRRDLLETVIRTASPADRTSIFGLLSDRAPHGVSEVLDLGLNDRDPAVRASAMGAVAKNWPTLPSHLVILRQEIDSSDERIAQAALGAITDIGDDHESDKILRRMEAGGSIAAQAQVSLTRLYGSDLGNDPVVWRDALHARQQLVTPMIQEAQVAFAGTDKDAIRAALHQLLMLRNPPRSDIAEAIAPLLQNADPAIAALARDGLKNLSGGVARLSLMTGGPPFDNGLTTTSTGPRKATAHDAAKAAKAADSDNTSLFVLGGIAGFVLLIVVLLIRAPVKTAKAIKVVTRTFRRRA